MSHMRRAHRRLLAVLRVGVRRAPAEIAEADAEMSAVAGGGDTSAPTPGSPSPVGMRHVDVECIERANGRANGTNSGAGGDGEDGGGASCGVGGGASGGGEGTSGDASGSPPSAPRPARPPARRIRSFMGGPDSANGSGSNGTLA